MDNKVLFARRQNTGWQDGKLSLPSGHAKNIAKGKMSAAYWANRIKW